jgi:hypothetical protein
MKTLLIVDLVTWGLIAFLKYGPRVIIWLFTWSARRAANQARKRAEQAKLDAAIAKANFKAKMRHAKSWHDRH